MHDNGDHKKVFSINGENMRYQAGQISRTLMEIYHEMSKLCKIIYIQAIGRLILKGAISTLSSLALQC